MRAIIIMHSLKILQILILSYFTSIHEASSASDKVFCYYESWDTSFSPKNIIASICTHVNYAYLNLESDGSLSFSENASEIFAELQELKTKNQNLKLLFSIGGHSNASTIFSNVAANNTKTAQMAASALKFLQTHHFDGIDIKWVYPGGSDKKNLVDMLYALRNTLQSNGDYLLTIAVASHPVDSIYDVSRISELVDYVHVMAYNFHRFFEGITSQNAPLYASSKDKDAVKNYSNCHASIQNWRMAGVRSSKLVLGLAFFGTAFQLTDHKDYGVGAPTTGLVVEKVPYHDICKLQVGWHSIWDNDRKIQYKHKQGTWIGYDNPISIDMKVQYAQEQKLAGVMVSAVNMDDTDGSCGPKNALLKAIKTNVEAEALFKGVETNAIKNVRGCSHCV